MQDRWHNPGGQGGSETGPHEEFLEFCALSTSGELTEEERKDLQIHLAECPACRQALKEFEAAASIGVPLLHPELSRNDSLERAASLEEAAKATSSQPFKYIAPPGTERASIERSSGLRFPNPSGHRSMQMNWNYVWTSFAAAVVLTASLGIYSYQFGKNKGTEVAQTIPQPRDIRPGAKLDALEQQISDTAHERELLKAEVVRRDGTITELRRQFAEQSAALAEMKNAQATLERSLQGEQAAKQLVAQERSDFLQRLDLAQASLQKTQAELDTLRQQRSQDQGRAESLEAQIKDLHSQLRDQERAMSKQEELLASDRDIRELMGARDLYIAEVYDVARDGQTQKPYGRVFYTREKSLVFYAYDLDQQAGVKNANTFQAWGRRGADKPNAVNLGIFFQDSISMRRWVLNFDDPQTLAQIDGVFVTVEPKGGSPKPSGKALLFASLKIEPNHP